MVDRLMMESTNKDKHLVFLVSSSFTSFKLLSILKGISYQIKVESLIIIFFIIIHPDFSKSNTIFLNDIDSCFPRVGTALTEYMSNMGTGDNFQCAPTHPYLKITWKHELTK